MKFACERCGRSYALADELRGKTFKMKCKACGHVIVVKGTHAVEPAAAMAPGAPGREATPSPVTIPGPAPGEEPLTPAVPEVNPFVAMPVSAAHLQSHGFRGAEAGVAGVPAPAAAQDIDLVLDETGAGAPAEAGQRTAPRPPPRSDGAGFPDPFADLGPLAGAEQGRWAEPIEPARPPPLPGRRPAAPEVQREPSPEPAAPAPPAPEGLSPKVLAIAGAMAVAVVAVLLLVYVGRSGRSPGSSALVPAQPAPVEVQPAAPPPRPAPAEPIPAVAAASREHRGPNAEAAPHKPGPARVAPEGRRPEPTAESPQSAPQPPPEPPPEPAPSPAPAATSGASAAEPAATGPLTSEQVGRVATANKRAFEQCIADAGERVPALDLAGRRVTLTLTVNPAGQVADPTLDDVELDQTDLGACLKSAGRLMIFPAFEGGPMTVEVPLTLGR